MYNNLFHSVEIKLHCTFLKAILHLPFDLLTAMTAWRQAAQEEEDENEEDDDSIDDDGDGEPRIQCSYNMKQNMSV